MFEWISLWILNFLRNFSRNSLFFFFFFIPSLKSIKKRVMEGEEEDLRKTYPKAIYHSLDPITIIKEGIY